MVTTPHPLIRQESLHFGTQFKNRLVRGVPNGVLGIVNNASVARHAVSKGIEVTERRISAGELDLEIAKITKAREKFCTNTSPDAVVFTMVAENWLDNAEHKVKTELINTDAALYQIGSQEVERLRLSLTKTDSGVQSIRDEVHRLTVSLKEIKDPVERDGKILEIDRLDKKIEEYRLAADRIRQDHDDYSTLTERMVLFLQTGTEVEAVHGEVQVAETLSYPEMLALYEKGAGGFVVDSDQMGPASHPLIFSHGRGIPVVAVRKPLELIQPSYKVSIDSRTGQLFVNPTVDTISALTAKAKAYHALERAFKERAKHETTLDGRAFPKLMVNIKERGDMQHLPANVDIGLFRTEGLYVKERPMVQTLVRTLKNVISRSRSVNIRLLDVDDDKIPKFFSADDIAAYKNSRRGIDFLLKSKIGASILDDQLQSVIIAYERLSHDPKAGLQEKTVRIVIPMVNDPHEVAIIRRKLAEWEEKLLTEGIIREKISQNIQISVMVETSSAVLIADRLAQTAQHFCIGGNDLTLQLLGFHDRKLLMTGKQYDWLSPQVLGAIKKTIDAAKSAKQPIMVECCGEMSRDPMAAIQLHLMGIDALSMDHSYVREIGYTLSSIHDHEWKTHFPTYDQEQLSVVDRAINLEDALEVREFMYKLITERTHADTQMLLGNVITAAKPITYIESATEPELAKS